MTYLEPDSGDGGGHEEPDADRTDGGHDTFVDADDFDADVEDVGPDVDLDANVDGDTDGDPDVVEPDADPDTLPDGPLPDILERLQAIQGMTVFEMEHPSYGSRWFELYYEQPVDHRRPQGETFEQYMSLLHVSEEAPFVLATTGYDNYMYDYAMEVTVMLGANQISFEHRHFGVSVTNPAQWEHLNIRQAAEDSHRIVEALRGIYTGSWISTGASKGGMTSVFHRRFYPDDVDGTVAYVAPMTHGAPDQRYIPFLEQVGGEYCRNALTELQVEALERKDILAAILEQDAQELGLSFELSGGPVGAVESATTSAPFGFWQYWGVEHCWAVPASYAEDYEIYSFLATYSGFSDDETTLRYLPYSYQAVKELGFPAIQTAHIDHLLSAQGVSLEELLPGVPLDYDPEPMEDVARWVATQGSELMFVYGEHDPWTAGEYVLGNAEDSFVFTVSEGTHYADIMSLPSGQRAAALEALERWTGTRPTPISGPFPISSLPREERHLRLVPPLF